jgi:hypothetical protein
MTQPPSQLPPAGWYRDPVAQNESLRYWDGSMWVGIDRQKTGPEPTIQSGAPWATYWADLKWSAMALWSCPFLAIVSVALLAIVDLGTRGAIGTAVSALLTLIVEVFLIGFVGTQRVWFLRHLNGERFDAQDVWTVSWRFFGRFLCLGLLGVVTALPIFIPLGLAAQRHRTTSTAAVHFSPWVTVGIVVWAALSDVVLTFVVPALAFNVRSVWSAFALGWRLTRRTWPTNAWYMFTPGVTIVALAVVLPRSVASTSVYVLVGVVSTLVSLLFKGATVPFYVRSLSPASPDGAANVD